MTACSSALWLLVACVAAQEEECAEPTTHGGQQLLQVRKEHVSVTYDVDLEAGLAGLEAGLAGQWAPVNCSWKKFNTGVPSVEGPQVGEQKMDAASDCEKKCDEMGGCAAFARCGSNCYFKSTEFNGDEPTKSSSCAFHYRRCPPPSEPGCYIKTPSGIFKLMEQKPGYSRIDCTKAANTFTPTFVADPAAPKPTGALIRFADQNMMTWRTWCFTNNWKDIFERIRKLNPHLVAYQEVTSWCGNEHSGDIHTGPATGKNFFDDLASRSGNLKLIHRGHRTIGYNPNVIKYLGEKHDDNDIPMLYGRFQHIETGVTFWYMSVHTGGDDRGWCGNMHGLNEVVKGLRARFPHDGFVHAGDYNTWSVGREWGFGINYLKGKNDCRGKPQLSSQDAWKDATEGEGDTFDDGANRENTKIDHIFYSREFKKKWSFTAQPVGKEYSGDGPYADHTVLAADLYIEAPL